MRDILISIAASPVYRVMLVFFALYPLFAALLWVWSSVIYFFHRERSRDLSYYDLSDKDKRLVTVIVPSYDEGLTACGAIASILALDYPNLDLIICDDGSDDDTLAKARSYLSDPRVTVVHKCSNEGKAMAINDVMPLVRSEFILVIDGDGHPHPDLVNWMLPHFLHNPSIGAVTGNPRVHNRRTILAKIQTVEFSSIISLMRRAQVVWGRVMTVSGICAMYRKSALEDAGLFVYDSVTEDISTTWELQRHGYQIHYEPRALVDMEVPEHFKSLWEQRLRWARGLAQTLRRNIDIWRHWSLHRLYPVFVEATLSIVWAYVFVFLTVLLLVSLAVGIPLVGLAPIPSWWGMLIGTMSLIQLGTGVWMDRHYDKQVSPYYFWAALYPLGYWIQMATITAIATPGGLLHPHTSGRWRTIRT